MPFYRLVSAANVAASWFPAKNSYLSNISLIVANGAWPTEEIANFTVHLSFKNETGLGIDRTLDIIQDHHGIHRSAVRFYTKNKAKVQYCQKFEVAIEFCAGE